MADNISNSNEQRQFNGGGGNGANNNNMVTRKKANNISGGDLTASPKYNKSNSRGYNKEIQQQKQYRGNNNNNRQQRGGGNFKYRNEGQNNSYRSEKTDNFDLVGVDDENPNDETNEDLDFDDHYRNKRGCNSAKKTNMSHLLNFHYVDKQRVNVRGNRRSFNSNYYLNNRWSSNGNSTNRQSFSKEQFLQANCQFIVQADSNDYSIHFANPDVAIDWSRVEQVRLHSMHPLKCPICLSEPQAGKITRCGHVYCWSCLLHYLALSDKPWRKCPVCSESIYKEDIRSVRGIVSRCLKPGDWITFRLMCRERGSVLFHPRKNFNNITLKHEPERLLMKSNIQQYAHLLSADNETILSEIIEKEKFELLQQLEEDGDQPEACFIKQALEENNEREKIVRERIDKMKNIDEIKLIPKQTKEEEKLLPTKPVLVYDNAFNNIIESRQEEKLNISSEEKLDTNISSPTDKSPLCAASVSNVQPNRHYFYKADDIYHAYLSGLNTRILLHEYGSYQQCPDELHFRVEAIESFFMTEELRSQFRSLSHLPLTCEFQVIEIRLHPPLISSETMQMFADEIHHRRQLRVRKERLEKRRQQQAELVESQKLLSQYPPEMMYIPQESFPINGTNSMEEFPAMISSVTSSSPPSATVQLSDENLSPPTGVSFAQMLKQQAPPVLKPLPVNKSAIEKSVSIDISKKTQKNKKKKNNNDSDEDHINDDEEYYANVPNFHSSFSLEEVFDRLKLVNGEEHPASSIGEITSNVTTKKKNKKNKQVLFATGLGSQVKL
ncbi:unnamed protein product [Rotaria sp. Silwood1]|nr:unnamed protein product [Rotaria sp. Silwood1]CAF1128362.1 unnamed protein product [Rotaria sp. Silwood1]CAF3439337.1 unnamed protein product [Rotaria sp. Silwood1]CAF3466940.1 unnamed protein product [Rotaria sp. Silwood1]CAF4824865.1 unnamed protein product [Rotaria sp. Silwood1]